MDPGNCGDGSVGKVFAVYEDVNSLLSTYTDQTNRRSSICMESQCRGLKTGGTLELAD